VLIELVHDIEVVGAPARPSEYLRACHPRLGR
jgi:hypothetical protein